MLAVISSVLASSAGEGLEKRLPRSAAIEEHASLAGRMNILTIGLVVFLALFIGLQFYRDRRQRPQGPGTTVAADSGPSWGRPVSIVLSVCLVVMAVITTWQVVEVGHTGSSATWADQKYVQPGQGGGSEKG